MATILSGRDALLEARAPFVAGVCGAYHVWVDVEDAAVVASELGSTGWYASSPGPEHIGGSEEIAIHFVHPERQAAVMALLEL